MDNNSSFNKAEFAQLLEKAKGSRSINQFALASEVSAAHISRFLRQLLDTPPSPETISKLAAKAYNGVTYQELMIAAGHLAVREASGGNDYPELSKASPAYFRNGREVLEKKFVQVILADLFTRPFKWSVEKPDGRSGPCPDMILNIDADGYKRWYFQFKATMSSEPLMPSMHLFNTYGTIAATELEPSDKFTIVVNEERMYSLFFKTKPVSLRGNIHVMLLDLDKGEVVKEERLCKYEK